MNSEKLKQMQSSVRLGGKGSVRRKHKYVAPPKLSAINLSLEQSEPCAAAEKHTNVVLKPEQISPNKDATTNKQSTKKPVNAKANSASAALADEAERAVESLTFGDMSAQEIQKIVKHAEHTLPTSKENAETEQTESTLTKIKTKQGKGFKKNPVEESEEGATFVSKAETTAQPSSKEHNKQVQSSMFADSSSQQINKLIMEKMKLEQSLATCKNKVNEAIRSLADTKPVQVEPNVESKIKKGKGSKNNPVEERATSAFKAETTAQPSSKEHNKQVQPPMFGNLSPQLINKFMMEKMKLGKQAEQTLATCKNKVNEATRCPTDTKPTQVETIIESKTKQAKGLINNSIEKPGKRLVGGGAASAGKAETTAQRSSKAQKKLVQSLMFADVSPQQISKIAKEQTKIGKQTEPTEDFRSPSDIKPVQLEAKSVSKPINMGLKTKQGEGLINNPNYNERFSNSNEEINKQLLQAGGAAAFADEVVLKTAHSSMEQTFLKKPQQIAETLEQQSKLAKDKMSSIENQFIAHGLGCSIQLQTKQYLLLDKIIEYQNLSQCFLSFIKEPEESSNVAGGGAEIDEEPAAKLEPEMVDQTGQKKKTLRTKKPNTP